MVAPQIRLPAVNMTPPQTICCESLQPASPNPWRRFACIAGRAVTPAHRPGASARIRVPRALRRSGFAIAAGKALRPARAEASRNGLQVTTPNGYVDIVVDDHK